MHAIESHKERRTSEADESAREYGVLKKTVGDLQQSIDDLARQDSDTEQVIIAKTAEIESLSAVLSAWSHEATQAGFDPEADSLFHAIAAAGSKNQAEKQSLTDAILIEKSKVSVAGDRQKEILQAEKVTREQLSTSLNDFEVISMKKADLERELRLAGTDPGATDKDLKSRIEGQNSLIELQEKAISEEEASYSARQAEVLEHSLSLRGLLAKQQSIEERSREARAKTSRFGSRLERAGLHLQGTIEEIDAKTGELERKRKVLREGETKVRFLEKILDSASRTAEMNDIETELGDIREKQKALRLAISQLKTARRWFGSVRESLQMKRERAVESHILAYGPLASVIQSRLRAVFGFGQIRLESKKDEIHVSVSRGSRYFRPTDYFSESQKQILMLSLFVAGRLTQNWSGFAPILLDDPVTHFDDLNAYCFVELLKGLLQDNASSKQFFISTCEERLFALMRDKLRDLEGGARFYQFKGISSDGPDISILDS
jgi:exonuclease SbcC